MTRGRCFRVGWKCLEGGSVTVEPNQAFQTLIEARAAARRADYSAGLGRRVFLTDSDKPDVIYRSWRVRLGPDYLRGGRFATGYGRW